MTRWRARIAALVVAFASQGASAPASVCHGTPADGRLENGVQLPERGVNFRSYAPLGVLLGRTYVHSTVHDVVVDAYGVLAKHHAGATYVYGETGFADGGEFRPHRTHRNGTSVDFMVPVRLDGESVPLPRTAFDKYGYAHEFDDAGRFGDYTIDFEALAAHLDALDRAARGHGIGIARVILEVPLQQRLFATKQGASLRGRLPFSTKRAWVRHDEHYHVDFALRCTPLR